MLGLGIAAGCNIAGPLLVAHALDVDLPAGDEAGLMRRCALVAGAILTAWTATFLARVALELAAQRAMATLKGRLFDHLVGLDVAFHDRTPSGSLIGRIQGDVEALRTLFVEVVLALPAEALLVVGMLVALVLKADAVSLPVIAVLPVFLLLFGLFRWVAPPFFQRQRALVSQVTAGAAETVRAMPVLRALGRHLWAERRAADLVEAGFRADVIANLQPIWYFNAAHAARALATVALLVWGSMQVAAGEATVGSLVMALAFLRQLYQPLMRLSEHLATLERARASAARIEQLLHTRPTITDPAEPVPWPGLRRSIRLQRVDFSYVEGKPVLRGLDLELPAGSRTGIVGPTGSGKSTLIDLLLRFRDPDSGSVQIDGVDLRALAVSDLRQRCALVLQEVQLLPGTVLENLGGEPAQARQALGAVGLDWPLERQLQPEQLSRGERQLLTFARALIGDPDLIVLDEATSAIDPATEARVQRAFDQLALDRTVVIVAHRLETVRDCDRIYVMRAGEVIEAGTHADLVAQDGVYAELVRQQTGVAA
jgi:ABC-type multidrug transport system fused ATPase/permease subunit